MLKTINSTNDLEESILVQKEGANMPDILWCSNIEEAQRKAQEKQKALFIDFYVPG
ncbi:hypothetical protein L0156_02075 [bacterium]|nr:hypothetical protein [bacterium]